MIIIKRYEPGSDEGPLTREQIEALPTTTMSENTVAGLLTTIRQFEDSLEAHIKQTPDDLENFDTSDEHYAAAVSEGYDLYAGIVEGEATEIYYLVKHQ